MSKDWRLGVPPGNEVKYLLCARSLKPPGGLKVLQLAVLNLCDLSQCSRQGTKDVSWRHHLPAGKLWWTIKNVNHLH